MEVRSTGCLHCKFLAQVRKLCGKNFVLHAVYNLDSVTTQLMKIGDEFTQFAVCEFVMTGVRQYRRAARGDDPATNLMHWRPAVFDVTSFAIAQKSFVRFRELFDDALFEQCRGKMRPANYAAVGDFVRMLEQAMHAGLFLQSACNEFGPAKPPGLLL